MLKRFVSLCLVCMLSLSLFSVGTTVGSAVIVGSEDDDALSAPIVGGKDNDVTWTFSAGTLTLSGTGATSDYDGAETPWFEYRDSIERVEVSEGVTYVGSHAFEGYPNLETVAADTIFSVGDYAFAGCPSLTRFLCHAASIDMIQETIGKNAFAGCSSLEVVYVYSENSDLHMFIDDKAFAGCTNLAVVSVYSGTFSAIDIGARAFENCGSLETVNFGFVGSIGEYAFTGCSSLVNFALFESNGDDNQLVTFISSFAFSGCSSLETFSVSSDDSPWHLYFGDSVFDGCVSLTDVHLPAVEMMGSSVFAGCSSLKAFNLDINNSTIKLIDDFTFANCTNLERVYLPASVAFIRDTAFTGVTNVTVFTSSEAKIVADYCHVHVIPCVSRFLCHIGDVDFSDEFDVIDVTCLQRYLVGIPLSFKRNELEYINTVGDIDGDGELTVIDVTYGQRYLVEIGVPSDVSHRLNNVSVVTDYSMYNLR